MNLKHTSQVVLSIAVLGMVALGCKSKAPKPETKSGVEYYRSLQFSETPYDIEKGTHMITPEEAKTVNSYKFTYDAGRLN